MISKIDPYENAAREKARVFSKIAHFLFFSL